MVKFFIRVVAFFATLFSFTQAFSQGINYSEYHNWGIIGSFRVYEKGQAENNGVVGPNSFCNRNPLSYGFGAYWRFRQSGKFSWTTGVMMNMESSNSSVVSIKWEDIFSTPPPPDEQYSKFSYNSLDQYSYSFHLILDYAIADLKKSRMNLSLGARLFFMPYGYTSLRVSVQDETDIAYRPVFELYVETPEDMWHASALFGANYEHATRLVLLKFDLGYTLNFRMLYEGHYGFFNLYETPNYVGTYSLSGNHFSLSLTVIPKRRKSNK